MRSRSGSGSGSRNGRRQTPQPFADDDDDNLWGEGFVDFAFEPYFLFGRAQIFALASQALPWRRHTHTHTLTVRRKEKQQIVYNIYCLRLRLLTMMKRQLNAISPCHASFPHWVKSAPRQLDLTRNKSNSNSRFPMPDTPCPIPVVPGSRERWRQCSFPSTYFHFLLHSLRLYPSLALALSLSMGLPFAVCSRIYSSRRRCPFRSHPCRRPGQIIIH